ncbi:MAG: TolC family protein [Bacteroidetes bacterium]|nr:TolC family protein [Bacteroidota bacterium]
MLTSLLHRSRGRFIVLVLLATATSAFAQGSRTLTLTEAEQQFLTRNLSMIAARYDVAIARAAVVTAGLMPNPELAIEYNVFNPTTGQWFPLALNGTPIASQQSVSLQQLIELAGKRGKRVDVASLDERTAEENVLDLARTLMSTLRATALDLYHVDAKLATYSDGIRDLDRTVTALNSIQDKGVLPSQEIVRIRSLLFAFQQERAALSMQRTEMEYGLRLLLRDSTNDTLHIRLEQPDPDTTVITGLDASQLLQRTDTNRPDVRIARTLVEREAANLSYQRSLAIPDVRVGLLYDKWASAWQDYVGLTMSVTLPIFDRNQGNIEAAQAGIDRNRSTLELATSAAKRDVTMALNKLRTASEMYTATIPLARAGLPKAMTAVLDAYNRQALDITQFTDMYSSYKNSMIQMIDVRNAWFQSASELNAAVGSDVINIK